MIVLMIICSQERPFVVLNYASSNHMVLTKGTSSIPGIGFGSINTILLLYFSGFIYVSVGVFTTVNYYTILMGFYVTYFNFSVLFVSYCFVAYLRLFHLL